MRLASSACRDRALNAGDAWCATGQGTYFAQDIEKVDQYTREEDRTIDEADLQHLHERLYPDREHPGDVSC